MLRNALLLLLLLHSKMKLVKFEFQNVWCYLPFHQISGQKDGLRHNNKLNETDHHQQYCDK